MPLDYADENARPVASAGDALQRSFDRSFPLKGLSEVNGSILSRARSGMVEDLLHAGFARIDEELGGRTGFRKGAEVRGIVADGSFSRAGDLIQRSLDDRRMRTGADVSVLEREFSEHLERIVSYIDAREGIFDELWDDLYGPKAVLLAKVAGY